MLKKISNFWYYYKYYILVGIVAAVALCAVIKSCSEKKNYDTGVLLLTHGHSESFYETEPLCGALAAYASDSNGDGSVDVELVVINYGNTVEQNNSALSARSANLAAGRNVIFLLDGKNYEELRNGGFLADMSELGSSEYLQGDRFDVLSSGIFSEVPDFGTDGEEYWLCLRVFDEKRAETDEKYASQYDTAKAFMKNVIEKCK